MHTGGEAPLAPGAARIVDLPDHGCDRAPLPRLQQRQARGQHEGAALDRRRHEMRPPALERRRAIAVLDGEQAEQLHVHQQRFAGRRRRADAIDCGAPGLTTKAIAYSKVARKAA